MGHLQAHLWLKNLGKRKTMNTSVCLNSYRSVTDTLIKASGCLGEEIRLKACLYNSFEFYISQQE